MKIQIPFFKKFTSTLLLLLGLLSLAGILYGKIVGNEKQIMPANYQQRSNSVYTYFNASSTEALIFPNHSEKVPLILSIPTVRFPCDQTTLLTIPIIVEGFDSLTTVQFSLNWDSSIVRLRAVNNFGIPSMSLEDDFILGIGNLNFGWFEPSLLPITLDSNQVLFELEMEVLEEKATRIQFANLPIIIEATDQTLTPIAVVTNNGSLIVDDCPTLPLDTFPKSICCPELENLISNGDFENISSVTNDYTLQPNPQLNSILPGSYGILTAAQANLVCSEWMVDDHTTNCDTIGNFLVINGQTGQVAGTHLTVWQQTLTNLEIGEQYKLCAFVKNLQQCCFDITPILYFELDTQTTDTILLNQSGPNDPCNWQEIGISFIATNTTHTIGLSLDETLLGDGNDIALDDISLYQLAQANLYLATQDQRPGIPNITASINLITTIDDTLPAPECIYKWTVAKVDSLDIPNRDIFLDLTTIAMGDASTGWGLTTTFPGYNGGLPNGNFGDGLYYIELSLSECLCTKDTVSEVKMVGRGLLFKETPELPWRLSKGSQDLLDSYVLPTAATRKRRKVKQ